jgi:hypothetical protein
MQYRPFVIPAFITLGALAPAPAAAQAVASLAPAPRMQFFDATGSHPLAGGCVQSFQAGSTTPTSTFSNASGTPNPNPVQLDSSGRADIWLPAGQAVKLTVRAKTTGCAGGGGAIISTTDNILNAGAALQNAITAAPAGGILYNNAGVMAGAANFTWNASTGVAKICPTFPLGGCTVGSGIDAPVFSAAATGVNPAFTQTTGTFQIDGNGTAWFQTLCVANGNPAANTCNGVTPITGTILGSGVTALTAGATITNTGAAIGIVEHDSGGGCNIGTGAAGGSIACSSDARLKKNVRDLPGDALANILKLRPVAFDWSKNNEPGIGFIAQEVEPLFPQLIKRGDDGYLTMGETGLIPELVRAIQQLNARVTTLEGRKH